MIDLPERKDITQIMEGYALGLRGLWVGLVLVLFMTVSLIEIGLVFMLAPVQCIRHWRRRNGPQKR